MLERGLVQLYTGDGKGKTTAALGLSLRAAGAGLKTVILQFMKGQKYSELDSLLHLKEMITVEQLGSESFCRVGDESFDEHVRLARRGLLRAMEILDAHVHDLVILDEIVTAGRFGLITYTDIFNLIEKKGALVELVLTGRGATDELIARCDLVTEMREIKHYYTAGVPARRGIES
jgi:cob(I)alamin adenosyltransferase